MKIGILTQPLANNYGGILQNWALQQALRKLGHEPITINIPYAIKESKIDIVRCCWRLLKKLRGDKSVLFLNAVRQSNMARQPGVEQKRFIENNISVLTEPNGLSKDFCSKHPDINAYVVGSDQVWRKAFSPNLPNFFLDFAKDECCKKIAYAVSFGTKKMDVDEAKINAYRELAQKFDSISVREKDGVDICQKQLGVNSTLVLDPTLLLSAIDYNELLLQDEPNIEKDDTLAVYVLDFTKEKHNFVENICRELKLKSNYIGRPTSKGFPSIESWLLGIARSRYVITDSYHGTLFSIIFKKQFTTIVNKGRGASRFTTILDTLALSNRLVDNCLDYSDFKTIDYCEVDNKLAELKEKSYRFLMKALGDNDESL